VTTPYRVTTDPPGASVSYRPYRSASLPEAAASAGSASGSPTGSASGSESAQWRALGQTPYLEDHFPVGAFRFRIEKEGFETVEVARSLLPGDQIEFFATSGTDFLADASYALDVKLSPAGSLPRGMLSVDGGLYLMLPLAGADVFAQTEVPAFLIDRTEVTNAAYREFVGAGGYFDAEHWREPFERDGETVPTAAAIAAFRDSTGRPGPAAWVLGAPPDRTESLPVSGVSWFEAAAYCQWRGMALPTLYHWARAAIPSSEVWMPFTPRLVEASNYGGVGTLPARSYAPETPMAGRLAAATAPTPP
jgi:hypothetical protein